MNQTRSIMTPQEERILNTQEELLTTEEAAKSRPRVNRMLKDFRSKPPRIAVERAKLFTQSFKETEGLPIVLRWSMALEKILNEIEINIGEDELIVGRCGPVGRYGLLYPELRGSWLEKGLESLPSRKEGKFGFIEEDAEVIKKEILPYWRGKTFFEVHYNLLPEDTRKILYEDNDPYTPRYILIETSTERHSLQWVLDYEKVLRVGFNGIKKEAELKMASLSPYESGNNFQKLFFLRAVIVVCDAMVAYAKRHAEVARERAQQTEKPTRKAELFKIAEACEWVPGNPARDFHEALQAMWFAQVGFRFEQFLGGGVGNGRIDQILYPYYSEDISEGRIDEEKALELLENLWLNIAQSVTFRQAGSIAHREGLPHFEATTIGGQTRDGQDATNELTYLILKSKKEFPLDFPDVAVRVHARTPERLLLRIGELIKEGTGFPKLINDEEVIPSLLAKGAILEEARDYAVSGCTEVRMPNRDTYLTGNCQINLGSALEMALNDGKIKLKDNRQFGVTTGDPRDFKVFDDVMNAFKIQVKNLTRHAFIQNQVVDSIRPYYLAAPLVSCLHDLCMENCADIQQGKIKGGISLGSWDPIGFGTVVDSLAAIKKFIFDNKEVSMEGMVEALEKNFEGNEVLRQKCLNAPKYGNNDIYADSIGRDLENYFRSISHGYTNLYGGKLDTRYVPVTAHVPLGRIVGATPNGRKAMEPLSDGISPTQGADVMGPTATLLSVARTKESKFKEGAARLFNMKLSPQAVAGEEGTKRLAALIRSWCDLKIWHLQFNIINASTLRAALKEPEKYRNLLVRVAGYSAYFVDLSPDLQREIIMRTEHKIA